MPWLSTPPLLVRSRQHAGGSKRERERNRKATGRDQHDDLQIRGLAQNLCSKDAGPRAAGGIIAHQEALGIRSGAAPYVQGCFHALHPNADIFETATYTDGTGCPIGFTSVNEGGRPVQCLKVKVRRPHVLAALGCENFHLGFSSAAPAWPLPAYRCAACLACSPAWTQLPPSWRPGATLASRAPPPSSPSRLAAVLARDGRQLARVCAGAGAACGELSGACAPACISLHTPAAPRSRHPCVAGGRASPTTPSAATSTHP